MLCLLAKRIVCLLLPVLLAVDPCNTEFGLLQSVRQRPATLQANLCEIFHPDYNALQPVLLLNQCFCWLKPVLLQAQMVSTQPCSWRSWLHRCCCDSGACWALALRLLHRASSKVLLGFLAAAAVHFQAVSVPLLAAAVSSGSSASVPVALPAISCLKLLHAARSFSSCLKPPKVEPAHIPNAIMFSGTDLLELTLTALITCLHR